MCDVENFLRADVFPNMTSQGLTNVVMVVSVPLK